MKTHATLGKDSLARAERVLGETSFLRHAKEIAWTHHEKWDGSGYPRGLKREEIPLSGRLMALATSMTPLSAAGCTRSPFATKRARASFWMAGGRTSIPG